jgi:hypothetical protein
LQLAGSRPEYDIVQHLIAGIRARLGLNPAQWLIDTWRMRRLVCGFHAQQRSSQAPVDFKVVLMPWLGTAVPWFSLACGLFLQAVGNHVTFVVDDLPFGERPVRHRFVVGCIRLVLNVLNGRIPILYLSAYRSRIAAHAASQSSIERLAHLNATWALRGETHQGGRQRYIERAKSHLQISSAAIQKLLQSVSCDAILVPGGVYGSSGMWVEHARNAGVRVSSFDSGGPGTVMLCADGIACQLQDIPRALALLKEHCTSGEQRRLIVDSALTEMAKRRAGVDRFASQIPDSRDVDSRLDGAIVVALNSSWDSAALGLHAFFESSTQWIVETVRYILENSRVPVVVRQHPAERLEIARSSDDYRALLTQHFGDNPQLHFIAADEPVNSYALLERASAVIVYTSTIGVEAASGGKVVLTASLSYYSDLAFVWKASTQDEYREHLSKALSGAYRVTADARNDALFCYYLTQCCNWTVSPFSPESFPVWSRMNLAELLQHEKVRLTVQSLSQNVPVAFLNHLATRERRAEAS